jgi:hypothetical protein
VLRGTFKINTPIPNKQSTSFWRNCTHTEIHKITEKGATKGTSLKIAMDPKELQEIRGNLK